MQRFTIPRDIYLGDDALLQLKELKGTKAVIVYGSERMEKDGTIPKIQAYLEAAGITSKTISGITHDPSVSEVEKGAEMMKSFEPDIIVAVGGGSPLDAAKAMWIFYEYPDMTFEKAATPFSIPPLRRKATFVAVSTTSGTGSEVTNLSIITDDTTNIKYPIADYEITPDIAIVDPALAATMTPTIVANTGMDALTHGIEAYVSSISNAFTDSLAMKSIEMTAEYLVASYEGDAKARKEMHISQCLAGMSFANAILGIVHSMAHKTGKIFDIAHGRANAIYLTYVIQFNAKTAKAKYADMAKRLGLAGDTEDQLVTALVDMIKDMRTAMKIPHTLKEYGVEEAFFKEKLSYIAEAAVADPCTSTNPRETSVEEMKQLFEAAYYGTDVNF